MPSPSESRLCSNFSLFFAGIRLQKLPFEILTGKYPIIHTSYFFPHIYYTKTVTQFDRLENTFYFTPSHYVYNKEQSYNVCQYNVFNYVYVMFATTSMLCLPLCLCYVCHYVYVTFFTMSIVYMIFVTLSL